MGTLRWRRVCARGLMQRQMYSSHNGQRDYNAAVAALNTLQSNFSIVEAIKKQGPGWNKRAIPEMMEWVRKIGYEVCVHPRLYELERKLIEFVACRLRSLKPNPYRRYQR